VSHWPTPALITAQPVHVIEEAPTSRWRRRAVRVSRGGACALWSWGDGRVFRSRRDAIKHPPR